MSFRATIAASIAAALLLPSTSAPEASAGGARHPKCFGKRATIVGSEGRERIVGTDRNDVIVAQGGRDEIVAGAGHDRICAGDGNDVVNASIGNDRISGGAGSDEVHGGVDADRISGGGGDDRLFGEDHPDRISPGPGDDRVEGGGGRDRADHSSSTTAIEASLDRRRASGQGTDRIIGIELLTGSPKNDTLVGNANRNVLVGAAGNDVLRGLGGYDVLVGGDGSDRIVGGDRFNATSFATSDRAVKVDLREGTARGQGRDRLSGIDRITLSRFDDDAFGTAAAEEMLALGGRDELLGRGGGDFLRGDLGGDTFEGGPGDDTASFVGERRGVVADLADGTATGQGHDRMRGIENLDGSQGRDVLRGDGSSNYLAGRGGGDRLFGRGGDDSLSGDGGNDVARCGSGDDTFFEAGPQRDETHECERFTHGDPGSIVKITEPDDGERLDAAEFRSLRAREVPGVTGPIRRARFAFRRKDRHGCDWWNAKRRRLVPGSCRVPDYFRARRTRDEVPKRWVYTLPETVRPGRYLATSNKGPAVSFRLR